MFPQGMILLYLAFIDFRKAYFVAGIWGWSYVLNMLIKNFVKRERPNPAKHKVKVSGYSFPSGHSLTSMVLYLAIAEYFSPSENMFYVLCALPILLGFSRLYLNVHRGIDVICGWWFGYLFLYFSKDFLNYAHSYFYDEIYSVFKIIKGGIMAIAHAVGF